ncbi:MAG: transposase [Methylocystaceae bacterium]|nr:transposase [Methylocystaceae bacterium]
MSHPFYSAQEFAEMELPKFPTTKAGILNHAKANGWIVQDRYNRWQGTNDKIGNPLSRKRMAQGGGWEFHFSLLPQAPFEHINDLLTKSKIESGEIAQAVDVAFKEIQGDASHLNKWQRDAVEARAAILGWIEEEMQLTSKEAVLDDFVRRCKAGSHPDWMQRLIVKANAKSGNQTGKPKVTVSKRTLKNWFADKTKLGIEGLAPSVSRETCFDIPSWAPVFLDQYRRPNKPSLTAVMEKLPDFLPDGMACPSYDQARRFLQKLSPITLNNGRMGPQALKSMKAFTRRGTEELWPTAIYSADGHTFKATVAHPHHGRPFRPEITAVIDIYTRYVVGWSIGLAEDSIGVLEALSQSIIDRPDGRHRGIPAIWYTDNGSGFRAKLFENEATGFYDRWGITPKNSLPYNSQARGVIERLNRTLWHPLAKTFPTYVGKDADKEATRHLKRITDKELRAGNKAPFEISWEEFMACVQDTVDAYNNKPHSSLPRMRDPETKKYRHLSPFEHWQNWLKEGNAVLTIPQDEAADLVRPYERRAIRRGEVRILNNTYFSFDLEHLHGEEALVGFDIHDASKVWVRDFDMRLLAVAELDGNKQQYMPNSTLREALSFQEKKLQDRTKGRLNLVEKKREEILEEAAGTPLEIKYQVMEQAPALTQYDHQIADEAFAKLEKRNEPKAEREIIPGKRPIFSNEVQLARWLIQNPDQVTEKDARLFKEKLRGKHFRQLLEFEDVPPDLLETIIAKTAVSNT